MSHSHKNKDLEARIVELENQLIKQNRQIKVLGTIAAFGPSSPFDSPLKQFFDAANFWDVIYEDTGACFSRCSMQYHAALKRCRGDKDCIAAAQKEAIACHTDCGPL
jgi:hypothetical protein